MTQARKRIVDAHHAGSYHCVARCVRRAWLCGDDAYLKQNFDHRKQWLEDRIKLLGEIFACGVYAFSVMSNHVHLIVSMLPNHAKEWSAEEVARRWVLLYGAKTEIEREQKRQRIAADTERVEIYRSRLSDLSWMMKSLSEPIARRANAEDKVNGRFWQGRFKAQLIKDDRGFLAAMTYVDLNPVRAKIANGVSTSKHTGVRLRNKAIRKEPRKATQRMLPLFGYQSAHCPRITEADYIELVDATGRMIVPGKRGAIHKAEPTALTKLGLNPNHWSAKVKGVGSGYRRVIAGLEDLTELAKEWKQRSVFGIGLARTLEAMLKG
jgi:REP element-mobilizing transposase RayT